MPPAIKQGCIDTTYTSQLCPLTQLYFFGSFNPVHEGHLYGARNALAALASSGFEEVVFVPSAFPPNKKQVIDDGCYPLLSMAERSFRLNRAITSMGAGNSLKVIPLEAYAETFTAPCFTANTLQRYFTPWLKVTQHQSHRLFLIMGEETFLSLPKWHQNSWLIQHCHFVVLPRPTHRSLALHPSFEAAYASSSLKLLAPTFTFLDGVPTYDVNATQIRQQQVLKHLQQHTS